MTDRAEIGSEHAPVIPDGLSCLPTKRALYGVDTYFRDGWEDLQRVAGAGAVEVLHPHASLLLKPDAVAARRLEPSLGWLEAQGAVPVAVERSRLTPHVIRALWQYQWNLATRDRRDVADLLMPSTESLFLVLRLPDDPLPATLRLSDMKGPAKPAGRRPGELRHLLGGETYLLNYVHTTDEPADLVREVGILVPAERRAALYGSVLDGTEQWDAARAAIAALQDQVAEQDLTFDGLVARVGARADPASEAGRSVLELLSGARESGADWREIRDRAEAAGVALDRWDLIVLGTHLMEAIEADREPILPGVSADEWRAGVPVAQEAGADGLA